MKKLSGAEMVVQSLRDEGVEYLFGYPGGAVLDIYDAIHTLGGIEHILVRHEQAAVHMADGYARSTGKVGMCVSNIWPWSYKCNHWYFNGLYRFCSYGHYFWSGHE